MTTENEIIEKVYENKNIFKHLKGFECSIHDEYCDNCCFQCVKLKLKEAIQETKKEIDDKLNKLNRYSIKGNQGLRKDKDGVFILYGEVEELKSYLHSQQTKPTSNVKAKCSVDVRTLADVKRSKDKTVDNPLSQDVSQSDKDKEFLKKILILKKEVYNNDVILKRIDRIFEEEIKNLIQKENHSQDVCVRTISDNPLSQDENEGIDNNLETSAIEENNICECGHYKKYHFKTGRCKETYMERPGIFEHCSCKKFASKKTMEKKK